MTGGPKTSSEPSESKVGRCSSCDTKSVGRMATNAGSQATDDFLHTFMSQVDQTEKDGCQKNLVLSLEHKFRDALARASGHITKQQTELEMALKQTLLESRSTKDAFPKDQKISRLLCSAKDYVQIHQKEMEAAKKRISAEYIQAAKYADRKLATSLLSSTKQVFRCHEPWKGSSSMIVILSDIYEQARILQDDQSLKSEWVAPSSFERATTKYWVKNTQLNRVLFAAVAEAPLLVYGKSGKLVSDEDCNQPFSKASGDKLWDNHSTAITSVYFDSPNLDLYQARLNRHEGSNLLRARWYGERKPVGSQLIFLELKTHHEKWVDSRSVKERVTIQEKDMGFVLALGSGKHSWTKERARKIVLAATSSLGGKELEQAIDLLLRVRDLIVRFRLRACVRTKYLRAAFQSPKSNAVRLTLDRNVRLIDERKRQSGRQWCLSDETIAFGKCHIKTVPYSVFEVKLSGSEMPCGIRDLVERSKVLVEAQKFSKYQTGAAAFNQERIDTLPYWASDRSFGILFGLPIGKLQQEAERSVSTTANSSTFHHHPVELGHSVEVPVFDVVEEESPPKDIESKKSFCVLSPFCYKRVKQIAPKQRVRVEPKSYFANERTFIQWISSALLLFTVAVILFDITMDHGVSHTAATFLICCGLFLACYALFTYFRRLRLLQSGSSYGYIDHVGPILITVSIGLGLGIYLSEVALGKTDPVLHQQGVHCYRHSLAGTGISPLAFEPSDLVYDHLHERLLTVSFSQITAIDVSSGLDYGHQAVAKSVADLGISADVEGLTMVGDVVYAISEQLNRNSVLYALQMDQGSDRYHVIGTWQVPLQDTEGITYIPDSGHGNLGKLLIAGADVIEAFDVPHILYPEQILSPREPPTLTPLKNVFNGRVVGYGTDDAKVGALTFFEGVLYVLMDNARVIRGWDLINGKIVSQVNLPTVGGGFNRQWEGMALRRVHASRRLRASSRTLNSNSDTDDTFLVLDLALDTPGQVWSFVVEETERPGQFKMPGCAAASYINHNATDFEAVAAFLNQ